MNVDARATMRIVAGIVCLGITAVTPGQILMAAQARPPAGRAGAEGDHFRVDMQIEQDGQRIVTRRYVDGPRSRMETEVEGQKFIMIELGDAAGTTYTLLPDDKRAMKMTRTAMRAATDQISAAAATSPAAGSDDPPMELVGTETIDGTRAEKYRVQTPEGDGFVWLEAGSQLPLRMEGGGATVQLKNYDFSQPSPELFQVPKCYDVMDMDQMMRSFSPARMAARGAAGMAGASLGGSMGGNLGGAIGASVGGALGGPVGAMVGQFLGQHLGKKAGQTAGAAAAGAVVH